MALTNREQTGEQFSTGTTADGNRIDRAMRDIVTFWNSLPRRNRARKYVQTQLVGGFSMGYTVVRQLPFLSVINSNYFYSPANDTSKRNLFRFKGTRNSFIDPATANPLTDRVIAWSPKFALTKGGILDGISVCLDQDVFGIAPNCPFNGSDLTVVVDVDDRWTPEYKKFNLVQYLFNRKDIRSMWSRDTGFVPAAYANTMLPAHCPGYARAYNAFFGFALEERGMGIALPELCRMRIGIVIPKYNAGAHGWTTTPWANGSWSWTATFLEEVE